MFNIDQQLLQHITEQLTTLTPNSTPFLHYNPKHKQWQPYIPYTHSLPPKQHIRSLTLNVLTDTFRNKQFKPNIIFSKQRYVYILRKTSQMKPDIISYNQVTVSFNQLLKAQKWVQEKYYISELKVKQFGNLLLTAIPPIFVDSYAIKGMHRHAQIAFIPLLQKQTIRPTCFCSVHLSSMSSNTKRRQRQLTELMHYLSQYEKHASRIIIQGDMNLHAESQNYMLQKLEIKDLWTLKHGKSEDAWEGYTFDSLSNSMINEIYWGFERRRMRLDRILVRGYIDNLQIKEMKVVFNEHISESSTATEGKQSETMQHYSVVKGSLLFLHDLVGLDFARKQKGSYLFASDHFGLVADMQLLQ